MKIFLLGTSCFLLAFIIQWLIWKIRLPKRQAKTLLQIFFATGIVFLCALGFLSANGGGDLMPKTVSEYLHISLLFLVLTLSYLNTYPGLEADSPSLVIVMTIHKAGDQGLPVNEFYQILNDDLLVKPRIRDLLTDHMAVLKEGRYCLTPKGKLMAQLFGFYRSLLGASKGG
ncbi:MAG: hypothetical protein COV66_10625 [Nitrospinae bacterium CG11_big_fil_rev_8_21_14_0_20_45_15]|nr:MAG: hypothetical protein COV66_10625 [Nitrospinae bacterium CG11_big_fil_rev_8_21_14_0_20_45_15]